MNNIIPLFVIIPLAGAFLNSLLGRFSKLFSDILSNIVCILTTFFSFVILFNLNLSPNNILTYRVGGWVAPIGIMLVVDHLSVLMLLTVNLVALCCCIYSISYMEKYTDKWKYYALFMLMLAGMNGVIITGDIFNMYVFLEIAAIASYALVAFGCESEELEASFKYLVLGSVASAIILLSIALIYSYVSSLNLADISLTLSNMSDVNKIYFIKFISILLIVGFGVKSALVPFHSWLPDAHPSAPAPISSMLSGVLIKTLGVYAMVRILFNILGVEQKILSILVILGLLSMFVGVILALYQWDYKRLLAYHSISQVGYIILGIGLATPLGILGGLFHLMNHSVFKSLLFLTSGATEYTVGTRDLRKMGELNKKMPLTTFSALIGSMSISGIPPFNGFWSKLIIIVACIQAKQYFAGFIATIVSFLTLSSFTKVLKYGFYGKSEVNYENIKEVPGAMVVPMIILSLCCIFMGLLLLPHIRQYFLDNVVNVLQQGTIYATKVFELR
jgi:multicomponent Na+:H+ antiporter subunit D